MDILSRQQKVLHSCFLQASAGTGKTFAIEQLVARFLLEGEIKITQILAVTFTQAAARDMRARIRQNLERLEELKPDYYEACIEKRGTRVVKNLIDEALICFDEASIFTIHGFCGRMLKEFPLEAGVSLDSSKEGTETLLKETIRHFLRTDVQSVEEAEELLKEARQDSERLIERIASAIENPKQASKPVRQVAERCRPYWEKKQALEEVMTPDRLLSTLHTALKRPAFLQKVRDRYKAIVIDEFQDTDPLSWEIFESLFVDAPEKIVYLVGDPKQSIYGFRSADIYTYVRAGERLGRDSYAQLDQNFRSRPSLIQALNGFFTGADWIGLPEKPGELVYTPVRPGRVEEKWPSEKPLRFFATPPLPTRERSWPSKRLEQETLFPYIAREMIRLHEHHKTNWISMAVLVKDRFQAQRLQSYLAQLNIPSSVKRTLSLIETEGFAAFERLLEAILHPENRGAVLLAEATGLLTKPISFSLLHRTLLQKGFPALCKELLAAGLCLDPPVRQTVELLLTSNCPPSHLLKQLRAYKRGDPEEEEQLRLQGNEEADQVSILTLFASKGLEYDVVFALGLASRSSHEESAHQIAEKMRQLYVACTRARETLYLPLIIDPAKKRGNSPLEEFWRRRFDQELGPDPLSSLPNVGLEWIETSALLPLEKEKTEEKKETAALLLPAWRKRHLVSFSSLAQKEKLIHVGERTGLPAGSETGIVMHTILERVFREKIHCCSSPERIDSLIESCVQETPLYAWRDTIQKMVIDALHYPLFGDLRLCDLRPDEVIPELEFLYPEGDRLVKGFIDLLFRYKDVYYLLDWKTNWISADYTIQMCMKEQDYFLQAALYTEAVKRYVKLFDNRPVAGALYFFLRGPSVYSVSYEEMASALATR